MSHVVAIGAGQAASTVSVTLREQGFAGRITVIGAESVPPYQRPPLSKKYLLGEMALERLYLRPREYYRDHDIALRLGTEVTGVDTMAKTVAAGGETLAYDHLVFATGTQPRRLPAAIGGALEGNHVVRSLADVDRMAPEFVAGRRVLIVGGGYIGLEAAAVAASRGLDVTLVEAAPRILQRVAAPETADYVRALHARHGVRIIEGVGLNRLTGDGRVTGAMLSDGRRLQADFVIVGIGVDPVTDLAEAAGIEIDNGIKVDALGRTSVPDVWAAGDCASFPYRGARVRLESVPNAIDQAAIVAANILGANTPYQAEPWFWSDQYDVKLQIAGLNTGYDRVVTRSAGESASFWYYRGDTLLAVDAVKDPRAYMIAKRLLASGISPAISVVEDPAANLNALLKSAAA